MSFQGWLFRVCVYVDVKPYKKQGFQFSGYNMKAGFFLKGPENKANYLDLDTSIVRNCYYRKAKVIPNTQK